MSGSFGLRQKLLIGIGIPIVLQLILVSLVVYWNWSGEREFKQLYALKTALSHVSKIKEKLIRLEICSIIALNGKQVEAIRNTCHEMQDETIKELQALDRVVKDSPEFVPQARELQEVTEHILEEQDKILGISNGDIESAGKDVNNRFRLSLGKLEVVQSNLAGRRDGLFRYSIGYRKALSSALTALVVAIPIVSIGMAIWILQGLLPRIKTLISNIRRLKSREELLPMRPGNDELSELGVLLQSASDYLSQAESQRVLLYSAVRNELRSPLVSLKYTFYLLGNGILSDLSERAQRKLQSSEEEVGRLVRLVSDLLNLDTTGSARFNLNYQKTSTMDIARRSLQAVQGMADRMSIALEDRVEDLPLNCDGDRIIQVLTNLLSNAIKFSRNDQTVTLSASQPEPGLIEFRVTDRGRGIPFEAQKKIFERFVQVEKADAQVKGGTGLGLAICRDIIEQHGGSIGVKSKPDEGSEFSFRLPTLPPVSGKVD